MTNLMQADQLSRIRKLLITELEHSADIHDAGRYHEIGLTFSEIDEAIWNIQPKRIRESTPEYHAYCLLDSWIGASNHGWVVYRIQKNEWPVLARQMREALTGQREFDPKAFQGAM